LAAEEAEGHRLKMRALAVVVVEEEVVHRLSLLGAGEGEEVEDHHHLKAAEEPVESLRAVKEEARCLKGPLAAKVAVLMLESRYEVVVVGERPSDWALVVAGAGR
jgi:hypothetical protein